jgi:hypothetical protein
LRFHSILMALELKVMGKAPCFILKKNLLC